MATAVKCDNCGSPALGQVTVDVHAIGVVVEGQPTSVQFAVKDSCEKPACRLKLMRGIFDAGMKQLERDIPRHKTMIRARAVMDDADRELALLPVDDAPEVQSARQALLARRNAAADDHDAAAKEPG